jgi:hypothetical protein
MAAEIRERYRRPMPDGAVWSIVVAVTAPRLQLRPGVSQGHEPVLVQALRPEAAIERFDERVVGRLAGLVEAERRALRVGPQVEIVRYELGTLVDHDRAGIPDPAAHLLKRLDNISR